MNNNIPKSILNRKGATKKDNIPPEVIELINKGQIETKNLTEYLAADKKKIFEGFLQEQGINCDISQLENFSALSGLGDYAQILYNQSADNILEITQSHVSDIIRSIGCYLVPLLFADKGLSVLLENIKIFARNTNAGVREIAWTAVRHPFVSENIQESIEIFVSWAKSDNEYIRRFAVECTRPYGVWTKHITELKQYPERALSILELLYNDDSRYVQNAVGNWLNDASKSQPEFVIELTNKWLSSSPTANTQYIVKRALRTINKNK